MKPHHFAPRRPGGGQLYQTKKGVFVLTLDSIFQYWRVNNICVENVSKEGANGIMVTWLSFFLVYFFLAGKSLENSLKKKTI